MGLESIHPGPRTTNKSPDHEVHPYLLRGVTMFLAALIDRHRRFVPSLLI
jgi:hypothetical protein